MQTGETLAQAGVTDTALFDKMNQTPASDTLKFLNSLPSSQLDEVTIGSFYSGERVTTYGDYKTYLNLIQSLGNRVTTLMAGDSNNLVNVSSSTNANEAEAIKSVDLINDIVNNKPGCITNAESYLSSADPSSSMTAPSSSVPSNTAAGAEKLGSKSSATTLSSEEILEILAYHKTEGPVTSASLASWGAAAGDTVLGESESNKIIDIASGLDTRA